MKTIHKFQLELVVKQTIFADFNWKVLNIQKQRGKIVLWALIDKNSTYKKHTIISYETGEHIPIREIGKHIGTVQDNNGAVWHFFEQGHNHES